MLIEIMAKIPTKEEIVESVKETAERGFLGLMLFLDSVVYRLASLLYSFFYKLAGAQIFANDVYDGISKRLYLFMGVIALFVFSFALLKAIVNPDEMGKTVLKSFKSLITSIVLLILMPTLFDYAFSFQSAVLNDRIIDQIFNFNLYENSESINDRYDQNMNSLCDLSINRQLSIGGNGTNGNSAVETINVSSNECRSNYMLLSVFEGFFVPVDGDVHNNYWTSYRDAREYIVYTGNFKYIRTFIDNVYSEPPENMVDYSPLISTAAGLFLCYIMLSFCIDLGIRCVKLFFYEVISPIPILMKIIPGKEEQFNKWMNQTISCFLELFSRIFIITFVMFLAKNLMGIIDHLKLSTDLNLLGKTIILLGFFMFAKQAPKLLQDAIGIGGDGISLGIKNKLTSVPVAGRAFAAGYGVANKMQGAASGALGAGWTSAVNGAGWANGMKYGAISGWKKGGHQFNAQRQSMYKDAKMGKGKAGWFGGQGFFDKKFDDIKDKTTDYYQDYVRPGKISQIHESEKWKKFRDDEYSYLVQKHTGNRDSAMAERERLLNSKDINNRRNAEMQQAEADFNAEMAKWQAKKAAAPAYSADIFDGEMKKVREAYEAKKTSIGEKYKSELNTNMAANAARIRELDGVIANENAILAGDVKKTVKEIKNGKVVESNINSLLAEAMDLADSKYTDIDETFKSDLSENKKRVYQKEVAKTKNSLEGQTQIALLSEAIKNSGLEGIKPADVAKATQNTASKNAGSGDKK